MGTTVRREPVVSKIPKAQDYKYLNITDFRGISKSSNPFTQPYNTASDALNVYVDETNALTTRPRLEKFADITQLDEIVAAFNITDGFLIQGKKNNNWKLYVKTATGIPEVTVPTGVTLNAKITAVFEQDEKIYFINGSNYYVITVNNGAYTVNYIEGYIPTTKIGGTNIVEGRDYESLNVLTNKYKKSYFWDGTWNVNDLKKNNTDVLDLSKQVINHRYDRYVNTFYIDTTPVTNVYPIKYIPAVNESQNDVFWNGSRVYVKTSNTYGHHVTGTCDIENTVTGVKLKNFIADYNEYDRISECEGYDGGYYHYAVSSDLKHKAMCFSTGIGPSAKGHVFLENPEEKGDWFNLGAGSCYCSSFGDYRYRPIVISEDGKIVAYIQRTAGYDNSTHEEIFNATMVLCKWNATSQQFDTKTLNITGKKLIALKISGNGDVLIGIGYDSNNRYYTFIIKNILTNFNNVSIHEEKESTPSGWSQREDIDTYDLSYDGSIFVNGCRIYTDFLTNYDYKTYGYPGGQNVSLVKISKDNDRIYLAGASNNDSWTGYYDIERDFFANFDCYFPIESQGAVYATSTKLICLPYSNQKLISYYLDFTNNKNLVELTTTITSEDENYTDWQTQREEFLTSLLHTRFNNEHWFASGNKTFYTQYNDPTYIPMKSYNINGDQDDITAMNVLSDSILGLYKKDDLWLVQQTYDSNGDVVYYYNENNNVVGNDAFNAAITTIHSNLPIQITYDGIYTIQQQENVSAPDRLAKSISDAIAELWQSETDSVVDNAITLNRLYWTYILLPYADFTKVYLLDNRTLSWYYWELPIVLASAFVKDNKVYFATKDSMLVTLETSDVTKILSQNASISEYYDLDRQIINWYWQSQILPLGTINYTKKLINTTFIVTDTDENDGYSLQYQFNVFRRKMGVTNVKNITNKLNYVQSVTKKTFISRFNFIQLKLSNMYDDLDNNKLRLVGLGLKYELLEGML